MKLGEDPVVVEQEFNAPIDSLWDAITKADQMRQWYFEDIVEFEPVVGFETKFDVDSGMQEFRYAWKVVEVIEKKLLRYQWRYEGHLGNSCAAFEVSSNNDKSKLQVSHSVLESFSDDVPEFRRESCVDGWNYLITDSLKYFLDGLQ